MWPSDMLLIRNREKKIAYEELLIDFPKYCRIFLVFFFSLSTQIQIFIVGGESKITLCTQIIGPKLT